MSFNHQISVGDAVKKANVQVKSKAFGEKLVQHAANMLRLRYNSNRSVLKLKRVGLLLNQEQGLSKKEALDGLIGSKSEEAMLVGIPNLEERQREADAELKKLRVQIYTVTECL